MPDFAETRDAENNMNEPQTSSFDQILPAHSAAIYREFQAGRVVVRDVCGPVRSTTCYTIIFRISALYTSTWAANWCLTKAARSSS